MRKRDILLVRNDVLQVPGTRRVPARTIQVGSPAWQTWLRHHDGFFFEGEIGHLSARRELRRSITYWYAYRRRDGKLFKAYLGRSEELTRERLEQASTRLAGQATLARLVNHAAPADFTIAPPGSSETDRSFLPLSKIKPPALPRHLIARPRLTQRINTPVTLVIAPSGFGKSTLLNEWQQSCGMPVAWVSLDKEDDHPLRFWYTVAAALQTVNPNLGQNLAQIHSTSPTALSEIVTQLANDVVRLTNATIPRIGLILDDYHCIQHPEIHASLQTLLDHLPPGLQLIISSHTKPPFARGHLRAQQILTEIQTDDLRFTLDEGIDFLWQNMPSHPLAYSEMHAMVKHTEGWVTGLALAVLALTQQGNHQDFLTTFTGAHTFLREYFAESVLYRQSPEAQSFLVRTSILRQLTGDLCDAVIGKSDGAKMLSRLWEENLFVTRLGEQDWYRYHDLFAEMLYSQLQTQCPSDIPRLHRQAAEWYRDHNAPADAVYHLLEIEDWEEAAALIESVAQRELEEFGEDSRLLRWLRQLPETVMQQHKTLLFVYLRLARVAMPPAEVEQFLARIEKNIRRKPTAAQTSDEQDVLAEVQKIRRLWAVGGSETVGLPIRSERDRGWQLLNHLLRYLIHYRRSELEQAEQQAQQVYQMALAQRHLFVILIAGASCAGAAMSRGQLGRSEKIAHQVLRHALVQLGKLPGPASITLSALSRVYFERNQLAQAHQMLLRAEEVDPNPTSTNMPVQVAIQRALIQSAQGNHAAALATMQAIRELHIKHPSGLWLDEDLVAYRALFCVRRGDYDEAERLLSEGGDADTHPLTALVSAEFLLTQKKYADAQALLTRLLAEYPQGLRSQPLLGARVMLAIALFEQHQINSACQVMADVVRLAAPEAWRRPFLDYGAQCAPLLALVAHTEKFSTETQSFVKEILRILGHTPGAQVMLSKNELSVLSVVASISARERQVLQMASHGASNQEIAAQLSISGNTVNTHLKNIYRKLSVNNRARALAQAQALKIV
ncbi:MAG: LuxR C-terminal-related transcriptional regulator [Chloroflexota bacterium]